MGEWTKEPPSEPGWYWVRPHNSAQVRAGFHDRPAFFDLRANGNHRIVTVNQARTGWATMAERGWTIWPIRIKEPPVASEKEQQP